MSYSSTSATTNGKTHNKGGGGGGGGSSGEGNNSRKSDEPIYLRFPVLSSWEFVLTNTEEPVSGMVYSTDEASQTVMLIPTSSLVEQQQSSSSSTTTTEIRILNANCIVKSTKLGTGDPPPPSVESPMDGESLFSLSSTPIHKKALEDRERRAMRQAEEVFRHINDKVSSTWKWMACHLWFLFLPDDIYIYISWEVLW